MSETLQSVSEEKSKRDIFLNFAISHWTSIGVLFLSLLAGGYLLNKSGGNEYERISVIAKSTIDEVLEGTDIILRRDLKNKQVHLLLEDHKCTVGEGTDISTLGSKCRELIAFILSGSEKYIEKVKIEHAKEAEMNRGSGEVAKGYGINKQSSGI